MADRISPTSTTAPVDPYANPTPGGSGGAAAANIAPLALPPAGQIIQIDQKKVPVFHGEPGKDGIDIREWIRRIDSMKTAFAWTEQATYENARAALFGYAATVMLTQCKRSVREDFDSTWTWLKKRMLAIFGNVNDSRAMIDILQGIKPRTNLHENMLKFASEIDQEFDKIISVMDKPNVPVPPAGHYTREECQEMCEKQLLRCVEQFNVAFMTNMLPPVLRTKVLEKDPKTVNDTLNHIQECQKLLLDEKRPTGVDRHTPTVHQLGASALPEDQLEHIIQAVQKRQNQNASRGSRGNNRGSRGNNRNSNIDRSTLKCLHCNRTGHGIVECFKRIEDELPCYNQKGEPYFPATDKAKREELLQKKKKAANSLVSTLNDGNIVTTDASTVHNGTTGQPSNTGKGEGSVFPTWV
jgi:hypothetical protein